MDLELPTFILPLTSWGFFKEDESVKDYIGICPFCRGHKFNINKETGQWICNSRNACGKKGNAKTFMKQYWEWCLSNTTTGDIQELAQWRSLPTRYFKRLKWAKDPNSSRFLYPVRIAGGKIIDLRYTTIRGKVMSSRGVVTGLLGMPALISSPRTEPVFFCAGEWDAAAMMYMLAKNEQDGVVIAAPEGHLKKEWGEAMRGRTVYLPFDNDKAGLEAMAGIGGCDDYPTKEYKLSKGKLRAYTKDIYYIHWPKGFEKDVNDWVKQNGAGPKSYREFMALFKPYHPNQKGGKDELIEKTEKKRVRKVNGSRTHVDDIVKALRDSRFEVGEEDIDVLKLTLATVLTPQTAGDCPVWLYIVGPPGSGKTAMMLTLGDSERVVYRSTLEPHTLISGWSGQDPSLIPELIGKTLALKDFTEVLRMRVQDKEEVYSALRGAFDGIVDRSYGNGVRRHYEGLFNIVAGVTQVIHGHTSKASAVGERFLKYQLTMASEDSDDRVMAAMNMIDNDDDYMDKVKSFVAEFIEDRIDDATSETIHMTHEYKVKMVDLVKLAAILRTGVERDMRRNISYRPDVEIGTRMAKQLYKLAWGLCCVNDVKNLNDEIWRLLARVGMDTATGFTKEVVEGMMRTGGIDITFDEIAERVDLPRSTLRDHLDDMLVLSVVNVKKDEMQQGLGAKKYLWTVTDEVRKLWHSVHGTKEKVSESPKPVKKFRRKVK